MKEWATDSLTVAARKNCSSRATCLRATTVREWNSDVLQDSSVGHVEDSIVHLPIQCSRVSRPSQTACSDVMKEWATDSLTVAARKNCSNRATCFRATTVREWNSDVLQDSSVGHVEDSIVHLPI